MVKGFEGRPPAVYVRNSAGWNISENITQRQVVFACAEDRPAKLLLEN